MFRVTTVADDLQEFYITMRTTNVFWRTSTRASDAARVRAAVLGTDLLQL